MADPIQILVLDDDTALLAVLESSLALRSDCAVIAVASPEAALAELNARPFNLFITDYSLNHQSTGLDMLRAAQALPAPPLVVIVTAFATLEITIEAIKLGCYDFLTKPFQIEELQLVVRNAVGQIRLETQNRELRHQLSELADSITELTDRQTSLLERLKQLADTYGTPPQEDLPELAQSLNGVGVHGVQRRQAQEKLSGYARIAEGLLNQVQHKQSQIRILYESGCLAEADYKRLMAGRGAR